MNKDIVFVDTSIYIAEKYFAPNNRILALRNLAGSGIINVVSTIITDKEVQSLPFAFHVSLSAASNHDAY